MIQTKRPSALLFAAVIGFCLLSCKTEDKTSPQPGAAGNNAAANASVDIPEGSVEISEEKLRAEAQQNPDDTNAQYNLGTIYLAQSKFTEAIDAYRQVVSKNPKDFDAFTRLGDAHAGLNQLNEAAEAYKYALGANPKHAEARHKLSEVYGKMGRNAEAEKERREFQRLVPNETGKQLLKSGKIREAIAELRKVADKNAETYVLIGEAHMKVDQKDEAIAAYRQAIRLDPKFLAAHFSLANAYERIGKFAEAAESFKQVVRLNPGDADAYFNLGNELAKLNRYQEAADAYSQAIKLNPKDADARYSLGVLHAKNGNRAAALEQHEELKNLRPESATALLNAINQGSKQ